jgi:integrase
MLELRLPGAKHDPYRGKGYAWRSLLLPVDPADPVTRRRAIAAGQAGGVFTVTCSGHRLRRCRKKAARVVFGPRRGERITPDAIRHVVAARLRTAAGVQTARRLLGHRTVASTLVYGGAGDRGPTPTEVQVYDASLEAVLAPDATPPDTADAPEPDTPSP